jgi:hypothetical protein
MRRLRSLGPGFIGWGEELRHRLDLHVAVLQLPVDGRDRSHFETWRRVGASTNQNGPGTLGNDHPERELSKDRRSGGIRGTAPTKTLAPACEGNTT